MAEKMKKVWGIYALSAEPDGRVYVWAKRFSNCVGMFAALFLFLLIPRWYVAIPAAIFGFWLITCLCGLLWYHLREALSCNNRIHKVLSALTLATAIPVGIIGFFLVPNWSNFDFNGHPSLVAVAGSVVLGILSFVVGSGVIALVVSAILLPFFRRPNHKTQ